MEGEERTDVPEPPPEVEQAVLMGHLEEAVSLYVKPGDALPSVRQIAADYQLNPITVSKAYQELVDESLVEKRRGLGMYVTVSVRP